MIESYRIEKGGAYSLCSTKVYVTINGKEYKISLQSGGYVSWDPEDYIACGPWEVYVPEEIKEHKEEIKNLVNEKVEWGCCGGCI